MQQESPKVEPKTQKEISQILSNLRKKAIKMVITELEYQQRRKDNKKGEFFYCRKVTSSPFGKGALKDEIDPKREMVYVFAKQYAFYLSKEHGLVKILNFKNQLQYGFKVYHKNSKKINFDETNLVLIKN